jgi:hypothetical protein
MFCCLCVIVCRCSEMFCWLCVIVCRYSEMFCWLCVIVCRYSEMFCWLCVIVCRYSESNVMHFLFSLLRIKGLCMFRTLLSHLQEALHKRHLVYCMRVMSVGCYQGWNGTEFHSNPGSRRRFTNGTWYTACVLCLLAATRVGVERSFTPTQVTVNGHNTHALYQVPFLERLLKMSK